LKQVYHEDGIADAVIFKLSPGIRGPEHTGSGYKCVDEMNCDQETFFLCAQAHFGDAAVDFLTCMDDREGTAKSKSKYCADKLSLNYVTMATCASGDEGANLKKNAALYFDKKFPKSVGIPHIEVNGAPQTDRSEASLIKALCATGIAAGACKKATNIVV